MKKIRVAVFGYGHLGKWHCQKVEAHPELVDFVAIVEMFPESQAVARAQHPNVRVVSDLEEVINDIDAAFIVTPTSTHFALASYLLLQGKHVFCEKPLCSNDEEALKLKAIAKGKNVIIQVGHSERFHQAWESLRDKFRSLPTPYTIRINRVAAFKGRATDVDVVQDLAIHDLDMIMFLFKQKPLEVSARGQKIRTDKWDHANIHIKMEDDCEAYIVVGRNHVKEIRDLEVVSQDGMIYVDLFANKIALASSWTFDDGTFVKEEAYPKRDHLLLEHASFYNSIIHGKRAVVNLEDGLNAVHLVDTCLRSMQDLRPVKVNFHA
ncbi:MAG TPA: Gfo/Idh/MocA family oxidoreductase [Bacteriovoracaceae bacterium]|nr:Gfo/Idh/MocA family oxidoreductase [Bacteriovoracaceae bacterium]